MRYDDLAYPYHTFEDLPAIALDQIGSEVFDSVFNAFNEIWTRRDACRLEDVECGQGDYPCCERDTEFISDIPAYLALGKKFKADEAGEAVKTKKEREKLKWMDEKCESGHYYNVKGQFEEFEQYKTPFEVSGVGHSYLE